jgi:hypothetical protein
LATSAGSRSGGSGATGDAARRRAATMLARVAPRSRRAAADPLPPRARAGRPLGTLRIVTEIVCMHAAISAAHRHDDPLVADEDRADRGRCRAGRQRARGGLDRPVGLHGDRGARARERAAGGPRRRLDRPVGAPNEARANGATSGDRFDRRLAIGVDDLAGGGRRGSSGRHSASARRPAGASTRRPAAGRVAANGAPARGFGTWQRFGRRHPPSAAVPAHHGLTIRSRIAGVLPRPGSDGVGSRPTIGE